MATEKPWSVLSVAEARAGLKAQPSADAGAEAIVSQEIADACARVTELLETACDRKFIMSPVATGFAEGEPHTLAQTHIIEQHDLRKAQTFIYVRHRPIRSLVRFTIRGTDQDLSGITGDPRAGLILFLYGSLDPWPVPSLGAGPGLNLRGAPVGNFDADFPDDWAARFGGRAGIRPGAGMAEVEYDGAWASTATIPGDLKEIAIEALARIWRTKERKSQGLTSVSTGLGVGTKFDQNWIPAEALALLKSQYGNLSASARDPMPVVA